MSWLVSIAQLMSAGLSSEAAPRGCSGLRHTMCDHALESGADARIYCKSRANESNSNKFYFRANINKLPPGGAQDFKRLWLGIIEQGLSLTEIFSISVVRN
jgi:hypothetical protein